MSLRSWVRFAILVVCLGASFGQSLGCAARVPESPSNTSEKEGAAAGALGGGLSKLAPLAINFCTNGGCQALAGLGSAISLPAVAISAYVPAAYYVQAVANAKIERTRAELHRLTDRAFELQRDHQEPVWLYGSMLWARAGLSKHTPPIVLSTYFAIPDRTYRNENPREIIASAHTMLIRVCQGSIVGDSVLLCNEPTTVGFSNAADWFDERANPNRTLASEATGALGNGAGDTADADETTDNAPVKTKQSASEVARSLNDIHNCPEHGVNSKAPLPTLEGKCNAPGHKCRSILSDHPLFTKGYERVVIFECGRNRKWKRFQESQF